MTKSKLTLIELPLGLRNGIERRQPCGNRFKDLTGKECRGYVVMGFAGYKGEFSAWLCLCHCGKKFIRQSGFVGRKESSGCGCGMRPKSSIPVDIRRIYNSMLRRSKQSVCKRWQNSMKKFAADMGPRPSVKHFFCRRNTSKGFSPKNCFWGTARDVHQSRSRPITYQGVTRTLSAWAKHLGISTEAMRMRAIRCEKNCWPQWWAVAAPIGRKPMRGPNE